jgi:hypothetical protein
MKKEKFSGLSLREKKTGQAKKWKREKNLE